MRGPLREGRHRGRLIGRLEMSKKSADTFSAEEKSSRRRRDKCANEPLDILRILSSFRVLNYVARLVELWPFERKYPSRIEGKETLNQ